MFVLASKLKDAAGSACDDHGQSVLDACDDAKKLVAKQTSKWVGKIAQAAEDNVLSPNELATFKRLQDANAVKPAAKRRRADDARPEPITRHSTRVFHQKDASQAIGDTILTQLSAALRSSCRQTTDMNRAHAILVDDIANIQPLPMTFAALRGLAVASSGPAGIALMQYVPPSKKKRVGIHITEAFRRAYVRETGEIMSHMDGEILDKRPSAWSGWRTFRKLSEWEAFSRERPTCAFLLMRSSEFDQRSAAGHDTSCCHTLATFLKHFSSVSPNL